MSFHINVLLPSIKNNVNCSLAEGVVLLSFFLKAMVTLLIRKCSLPKNELQSYHPVSYPCFKVG